MKYMVAIWYLFESVLLINQGGDYSGSNGRSINSGSCSVVEEVAEVVAEAAVLPYFYVTFESLKDLFYMTIYMCLIIS